SHEICEEHRNPTDLCDGVGARRRSRWSRDADNARPRLRAQRRATLTAELRPKRIYRGAGRADGREWLAALPAELAADVVFKSTVRAGHLALRGASCPKGTANRPEACRAT